MTPGDDVGVEGVAVGDENLVVVEVEVSCIGEERIVVTCDECHGDVVGLGEIDELHELFDGVFAVAWVVDLGGVAVDDEVVGVLPEGLELMWVFDSAFWVAEVCI